MLATNVLFFVLCLIIMFLPVALMFFLDVSIFKMKEFFTLTMYGIYIVLYMITQIIFSVLNAKKVQSKVSSGINGMYNVLAVGYREDADLFKKCLASLKNLSYSENINKVFIVIDGNEQDDMYMGEIAKELGAEIIISDELLSDSSECFRGYDFSKKFYCILQPHKGKRHALYTGLKLSIRGPDGVLCTDSDTELDKNSLFYLANLLESDKEYGAVTGNVQIINNRASIMSYLSSLRYWFACNLERAYQSYNDCVLCVSGPLGLYKTECLEEFLELWLNQKFLSRECTYGDDRHLTNNILIMGKKVGYTHLAECKTDTPETLDRFFTQQIRWCKSSLREFAWNLKCLDQHSIWMTIDLIYQTLYSFIVLGSFIYIMYFGTTFQFMIYLSTLLFFNAIKGLYAAITTGFLKYLLFTFYGLVYITVIAPAKLYAGLTINDTDWGTSSRLEILRKFEIKHIFLGLWNLLILTGVIFNLYTNDKDLHDYIALSVVSGYIFFVFCILIYSK